MNLKINNIDSSIMKYSSASYDFNSIHISTKPQTHNTIYIIQPPSRTITQPYIYYRTLKGEQLQRRSYHDRQFQTTHCCNSENTEYSDRSITHNCKTILTRDNIIAFDPFAECAHLELAPYIDRFEPRSDLKRSR